jgi:hypothetical protein
MIRQITQNGSVGVKVNDVEGEFFLTGKGVRQGDPLAPLLFNTVVDVFSRMLVKGNNAGLIRGLCTNLIPGGVVSLQYADDTLLFLENDREVAVNFKWILTCFEQFSGMRINYHKSELIGINIDSVEMNPFLEIFQCVEGHFPIKYLGLPLHFEKLKREELQPLVDSLLKRLSGWRGKLLSLEARRLLIQTVLASIPIYMLSFFKFPKWALKLINTQLSNCLWSDEEGHRKIHLANWPSICMKKEFGGLGIPNLKDLNLCLLGSWIKRYIKAEGSIWKKIVDAKYNTRQPNILCCQDTHPSILLKGVMWASQAVKCGYKWYVGNGKLIKFWEDVWFGNSPLATQYWDIYYIVNQQTKTISDLWDGSQLRCTFRRTFTAELLVQWQEILVIASTIYFTDSEDQLIWQFESNGVYSSQSMYALVNFRGVKQIFLPAIWKLKIPPRIQVFLWLFSQNKVMTRDNLRRRGMPKPLECSLCKEIESVKHLFFECLISELLWDLVFDVFGIRVTDFLCIASRWLCNTRHLQFNFVSSAIIWNIWNNRNSIVLNRKTWLNMK